MPARGLTPELQSEILGALRITGSIKTACLSCGVPWPTAAVWLRKGKQGREPYAAFVDGCRQRKAQRELALEGVVLRAAKRGEWRAAAACLLREGLDAAQKERDAPTGSPALLIYPVPMPAGAAPPSCARIDAQLGGNDDDAGGASMRS